MTSLCFFLAQNLMRDLKLGDHVLITEIDHEANRSPRLQLRERGIIVDEARIDTEKCILDLTDLERKLTSKTKIVAFNYALKPGSATPLKSWIPQNRGITW